MAITFNVGVADRVTYYFRMVYWPTRRIWLPAGIVPEEQAVLGGPTYGVPLNWESTIIPSGPMTDRAIEKRARVAASYYNSSNGCPGFAFLRLVFSIPDNGYASTYEVRSRDTPIITGRIGSGGASDSDPPGLPPGGDPDACADPNDGIDGGNS